MKAKSTIALLFILCMNVKNYGQFTFGVSPGIGLNSAYAGYSINDKIVPFFGFQYMHAGFKYEETGEEYDWELNQVVAYSYSNKFSGNLFIPSIGLKYFFTPLNKIKPYLTLCLSKPFLSAKIEDDGQEDDDFKESVKNLSLLGSEFGFGIEYFFDENFSLGGEFGLRYLYLKYKDTFETEIYNPNTGDYQASEIEESYRFNISPTYTKVALNYYF